MVQVHAAVRGLHCSYLDQNRERGKFSGAAIHIHQLIFFPFHVFIFGLCFMEAVESFDAGMPINGIWIAADQELTTKVSVNPLTPNSARSQNSRKIPNFFSYILKNDKCDHSI